MGIAVYVPPPYRPGSALQACDLVRRHPFATLVCHDKGELTATGVPLVPDNPDGDIEVLLGHIARRNPQAEAIVTGGSALAIFHGPDAYISPQWYRSRPDVPTWNYAAAQIRGTIEPVSGRAATLDLLGHTIDRFESALPSPWRLDDAPEELLERLIDGIVAFRIIVEEVKVALKLSQTKPETDRLLVIEGLVKQQTPDALALASLMADVAGKR